MKASEKPGRLGSRCLGGLLPAALAAALVCAALAPAEADAQARVPQRRTRITAAERKAAADARKAKMEEWRKAGGAAKAAPQGNRGGER